MLLFQVHSRIHQLDQRERERQHRLSAAAEDRNSGSLSAESQETATEDSEEEEEMMIEGEAASTKQAPHSRQGLFQFWDAEVNKKLTVT